MTDTPTEPSTSQGARPRSGPAHSAQWRTDAEKLSNEVLQREIESLKCLDDRVDQAKKKKPRYQKKHRSRKEGNLANPSSIRRRLGCMIKSERVNTVDVNFGVDERLSHTIETILGQCLKKINYEGELIPIGSTYDRTRVSANTDLDYLYVLSKAQDYDFTQSENITIEATDKTHLKIVHVGGKLLDPWELYSDFARLLHGEFEGLDLNSVTSTSTDPVQSLTFGGFAKPEFSGVRHNEPAVTLLFAHEGEDFSVDITIALEIPAQAVDKLVEEIRQKNYKGKSIGSVLDETSQRSHLGLHLVPVWPYKAENDEQPSPWYLTTAVFEQDIFRALAEDDNVRQTIKQCKAKAKKVSENLDKCYHDIVEFGNEHSENKKSRNDFHKLQLWLTETVKDYRKYRSSDNNSVEVNRLVQELKHKLQDVFTVAHTLLYHKENLPLDELRGRGVIAFNSSAFKYLALTYNSKRALEGDLTSVVLEKFCTDRTIQHTFLKYHVRSICVNAAVLSMVEKVVSELEGQSHNE